MHMIVDETVVPREPKKGSRIFLCPKFVKSEVDFTGSSKGARKTEIEQKIKKAPSFFLEALNHFFNFGSNTLTIGGGRPKLVDTGVLSIHQGYFATWKRDAIDYTEMASKRWVEKWALERLADHFGCSRSAIIRNLRVIKKSPKVTGLHIGFADKPKFRGFKKG